MRPLAEFLTAADAAKRLGVSAKALRLYEERGLLSPPRTRAGWRVYGPEEMERAAEVAELRTLGFGLSDIARLLGGEKERMERALIAHEAALAGRVGQLEGVIERVRTMRQRVARDDTASASERGRLPPAVAGLTLSLPWPWNGERFDLAGTRALTYLVGPLGSGKTRLAKCIAAAIPGAAFLGMDRAGEGEPVLPAAAGADTSRRSRVEYALARMRDEGASESPGLSGLMWLLEDPQPTAFVVDMIEQGLDRATQQALISHLRATADAARPIVLMTRSSAILDVSALGKEEAVIFCPANHAPPAFVKPFPGAPGFEMLVGCLATPDVRARTEGVIASRPAAGTAGHG
ncbi:DNA-binding transcriptional MerR regulator [Amorphus suaedae]